MNKIKEIFQKKNQMKFISRLLKKISIAILIIPFCSILFFNDNMFSIVFSQKNSTTKDNSVEKIPKTVSDDVQKRFNEYRRMNYVQLNPLAREAEKRGVKIAEEEIEARYSLLKRMYPGVYIPQDMPKNEILAKKYAQLIIGIKVSDEEKDNAARQVLSGLSDITSMSESDIYAFAETRVLINSQIIKDEIIRISDNIERMRIQEANKEEFWSVEELRISSGDNYCIAQHPDSSNCQLKAEKFNNLIQYNKLTKLFPLDTARRMIISQILTDDYILNQAKKKEFDKTDTAIEETGSWLAWAAQNARTKNLGILVKDEHILKKLYQQYYNLFFSQKVTSYCSLIGSDDSLYIDSLAKLISKKQINYDKKGKNVDTVSKPDLPWGCSFEYTLHDDISTAIDSLRSPSVSKVIKTSYGFFLARLDSVSVRPEISYEDANQKLVVIASKKKWENLDSVLAAKSFQIYSSKKSSYKTKDTLSVILLLKPGKCCTLSDLKAQSRHISTESVVNEEIHKKGIKLSSWQLPQSLTDMLFKIYDESNKEDSLIGPINSQYGVCYFKILNVKTGKNIQTFSQIKNKLVDSLMVCAIDSGDGYLYEHPDSLLLDLTLARVYTPRFFEAPDSLLKKTTAANQKTGIDPRLEYHKSKAEEIQAWINKIRIQIP